MITNQKRSPLGEQMKKEDHFYDDKSQVEEKSETKSTSTKGSMPKGWKPEK